MPEINTGTSFRSMASQSLFPTKILFIFARMIFAEGIKIWVRRFKNRSIINIHKDMNLKFRAIPVESDVARVREIVESTKFFYDHEVEIAAELVAERVAGGEATGYFFVFAELDGVTVAYSCYGPISMSRTSFDLYWIATHNDCRGMGIGRRVLEETCSHARAMGCSIIIAETSGLPHYEPTRNFYTGNGFDLEARLKDFYAMGDDKLFYTKRIKSVIGNR
jgi:GNAT superfamily N-acetyltransferase